MKIGLRSALGIGGGAGNFLLQLAQEIKRAQCAEIVGSYNPFQDIGLYSSVHRGLPWIPYILRLDGVYFDKEETEGSNQALNRPIYKSINKASGIIFQSEFCKELFESHYGPITKPNIVILNGANLQQKQINAQKKAGVRQGEIRRIICAAKWRKHKRLRSIIEAVRQLNKTGEYELIVLGEVGAAEENDSFITYVGEVPHASISQYLEQANLFLHLSWLDPCPNAVVEAITHGLPVVCSNQGGTPEIVRATNAGFVSECDAPVDYSGLVDLYNPPSPDINKVVSSVKNVFEHYDSILNKMDFTQVDIALTTQKYLSFCQKVVDLRQG
ncbi:MAG: hypothetical protein CL784_03580 [Chloroflexi bacterium]|nr:hypothetical protein [Chloroflexota bacterium]|tara:strand:- start:8840 stop:9823 length:984 start_codon:yes stop_codon:yes gene_type:complete